MKMGVFWVVTPCNMIGLDGTHCIMMISKLCSVKKLSIGGFNQVRQLEMNCTCKLQVISIPHDVSLVTGSVQRVTSGRRIKTHERYNQYKDKLDVLGIHIGCVDDNLACYVR